MNDMTMPIAGHNSGDITAAIQAHLEQLREQSAPLAGRCDELFAAAERATIASQGDVEKAADLIKMFNTGIKKADEARKDGKEPLLEGGKAVDAVFNPVINRMKEGKTIIERKSSAYLTAERQKAEAERKRLEDEARAAAAAAAEAPSATIAAQQTAQAEQLVQKAATIEAPRKVTSNSGATLHTRKETKWEIEDQALLPADYWIPDLTKIGAAVKAGITVPGVKVWVEEKMVAR